MARQLAIEWTANPTPTTLEHVRRDHRRGDILVSQEFLHGTDIGPLLQQVRGKAVPQGVATAPLGNPHLTDRLFHRLLSHTF